MRTPLIVATARGLGNMVEFLIDHGADVDAEDKRGATALYYATEQNHESIVRCLLAAGASVNAGIYSVVKCVQDKQSWRRKDKALIRLITDAANAVRPSRESPANTAAAAVANNDSISVSNAVGNSISVSNAVGGCGELDIFTPCHHPPLPLPLYTHVRISACTRHALE